MDELDLLWGTEQGWGQMQTNYHIPGIISQRMRTIHSPYSGRREACISDTFLEQGFKSRSVYSTPDRTGCDESVTQKKK